MRLPHFISEFRSRQRLQFLKPWRCHLRCSRVPKEIRRQRGALDVSAPLNHPSRTDTARPDRALIPLETHAVMAVARHLQVTRQPCSAVRAGHDTAKPRPSTVELDSGRGTLHRLTVESRKNAVQLLGVRDLDKNIVTARPTCSKRSHRQRSYFMLRSEFSFHRSQESASVLNTQDFVDTAAATNGVPATRRPALMGCQSKCFGTAPSTSCAIRWPTWLSSWCPDSASTR